jgi:transposase
MKHAGFLITLFYFMAYSTRLRKKALQRCDNGENATSIAKSLHISRNTIKTWQDLRKTTGSVEKAQVVRKNRKVDPEQVKAFFDKKPEALQKDAAKAFGVTKTTIQRVLRKIKYKRKKMMFTYKEIDEQKRQVFLEELKRIPVEHRVFIDESGVQEHLTSQYGYARIGARIMAKKSGKRFHRTNIIAGLREGPIAERIFKENTNTAIFNDWLENDLIPQLNEGDVVIMDNASFHKSKRTRELIERAGCKLLYLPPYSPDFNPIEKFWGTLKQRIRTVGEFFNTLQEAIIKCFRYTADEIKDLHGF